MYRCVATSLRAFVQQLGVNYVSRGYFLYATGEIPKGKDPRFTDAWFHQLYRFHTFDKHGREQLKAENYARMQYLRYGHRFVLLSTLGKNDLFWREEGGRIQDARRKAIRCGPYSLKYRVPGFDEAGAPDVGELLLAEEEWDEPAFISKGHLSVRMTEEHYRQMKERFSKLARKLPREKLIEEFRKYCYQPYRPVVEQWYNIVREVNRQRRRAGFRDEIGYKVLRHTLRRVKGRLTEPAFENERELLLFSRKWEQRRAA